MCGGDEAVGRPHPCGCMHVNSTTATFEGTTYANYLQQAGYMTGYFGVCRSASANGKPNLLHFSLLTLMLS